MGKRNWRDFKLYAITGANYHPGRGMIEVMEQAILGGADIVQLRAKNASKAEVLEDARALRALTSRYGVTFIVNDYIDIALAVGADGAHFGQEDLPLAEARRILGPDAVIGISTHSLEQALAAERDGADYIGVGPVYPTGTKPGRQAVTTSYVREAAARVTIPWVAIGGITLGNVEEVLAAGATRICAVSAIVGSANPFDAARAFAAKIGAGAASKQREANAGRTPEPLRAEQSESVGSRSAASAAASGSNGQGLLPAEQADGNGAFAPSAAFSVIVNGRREETPARTVGELVEALGLAGRSLVVELNGMIVAREAWSTAELSDGAVLELVHFVGGG